MTRRDRMEAGLALAMLPVGGTLTVVSALALVAVAALAAATVLGGGTAATLVWCAFSLWGAVWNLVRSIEIMSAFDWQPLPGVLLVSAAILATFPGWW